MSAFKYALVKKWIGGTSRMSFSAFEKRYPLAAIIQMIESKEVSFLDEYSSFIPLEEVRAYFKMDILITPAKKPLPAPEHNSNNNTAPTIITHPVNEQQLVKRLETEVKEWEKKYQLLLENNKNLELENEQHKKILDGFINNLKLVKKSIFLTFSSDNKEIADWVKYMLIQFGVTVTDDSAMKAMEDKRLFIEKTVRDTDYTLSIISTQSLSEPWEMLKIGYVLDCEKVYRQRKFMACCTDDAVMTNSFTVDAASKIEERMKKIFKDINEHQSKNLSFKHLTNEYDRFSELRNSLTKIAERLQDSNTLFFHGNQLFNSMKSLIETLKKD